MDAPLGVPGVSKNCIFPQINLLSSSTKIEPKLKKLCKIIKTIKKNHQKCLFSNSFLNFLQFRLNQPPRACLVDDGASFGTPGVPGARPYRRYHGFSMFLIFSEWWQPL